MDLETRKLANATVMSDRFEIRVDPEGSVLLKDHQERRAYRMSARWSEGQAEARRKIEELEEISS